jgi:hypothetical protein
VEFEPEVLFVDTADVVLPTLEEEGPELLADVEFDCENAEDVVIAVATNTVLNIVTVKTIAKLIFVLLLLLIN